LQKLTVKEDAISYYAYHRKKAKVENFFYDRALTAGRRVFPLEPRCGVTGNPEVTARQGYPTADLEVACEYRHLNPFDFYAIDR
jgi:hypothetical protein